MRTAHLLTAGRYTTVVLMGLTWGCQSIVYSQPKDGLQMLYIGGAVLFGVSALGWLRPQWAGLTAPHAMLLLGAIGMVLGLMVDSHAMRLDFLAGLCGTGERNLWSMMQLQWTSLPWMHVGMWIGGFAAIPLVCAIRPACRKQYCARLAQNVACSAWMMVGMSAGVLLCEYLAGPAGVRSPSSILGGMFGGMVLGTVVTVALYRLYFQMPQLMVLKSNRCGAVHRRAGFTPSPLA